MDTGITILAIVFIVLIAVILIIVTRSKSSSMSVPKPTAGTPTTTSPDLTHSVTKPPVKEDPSAKWTYTKPKEKFVPQDTVYEYRRATPCMLCPFCDAENQVGLTSCQVCGTSFRRGV